MGGHDNAIGIFVDGSSTDLADGIDFDQANPLTV